MRVLALVIVLAIGTAFLAAFVIRQFLFSKGTDALSLLIKRGKTQLAIKSAKQLISKDPKNAEARYYLGLAYAAEKKEDLAYREFKALSQLSIEGKGIPEMEYRQTLAQLYVSNREPEEALKEYLLLIKLMPKKGDYYYQAGKLFTELGKPDRGREYLEKAAELSPNDGNIYFELGVLLYKAKKALDAKAVLERALRFQKDKAQAKTWYYLGKLQKDVKDYAGALISFDKAAEEPEYRLRALVERGGSFMSMNEFGKAVPVLEKAVTAISDESSQDSLYARYFLGLCYEKGREIDRALAQWEKVYSEKKGFRDVGEKLSQYQDIKAERGSGGIKKYITAGSADFLELCKSIVEDAMGLSVQNARPVPGGGEVLAVEGKGGGDWQSTRKIPRLIRFYRSNDPAGEEEIRSILDDAREQNIPKAALVASGGFSQAALDFANNRPVELFGREKLRSMLHKAAQ
ncbi:MAG: tetratricopeptide repeat protein [Treponema sp.]|jgi:tetratricopeptide (TPR) repeat protein|nr:tetratricopeptide repeat protein [Treponema sp.]